MPAKLEQVLPNVSHSIPLSEVLPGENLSFPFVTMQDEFMRFIAMCHEFNLYSHLFIADADAAREADNGLVVIENKKLIPISTLKSGQTMVFDLKRKPGDPVSQLRVTHY